MAVASEHLNRSGLKSGSDQSYVVGKTQSALEEITVGEFFTRTVSRHPDREPVFFLTLARGGLGPSCLKRLTS